MIRSRLLPAVLFALLPAAVAAATDETVVQKVIDELNGHHTVAGTEESKSWKTLFDAYLDMGQPPFKVDPTFNMTTIHPGMASWSAVSGWAESNPGMADAIIASRDKTIIGLPYGRSSVPQHYREAGIFVDIGVNGNLQNNHFEYLAAVDTIAAYATAEIYRLMEANQVQRGLDLAVAQAFVLRQFCDRDFLAEKTTCIDMLSDALSNMRDVFYLYRERITSDQFSDIAWFELPFLRPDRNRLLMPEADRVISRSMIEEVFDNSSGNPVAERFASSFAGIQSADRPLTRFGAAKRWEMIAQVHGSLDASLERLKLVYDDWWRRWRVQEYDDILAIPDQFERTNEIRYAAVIYSMQDIASLFPIRNQLIVEVNGTAVAAGLCAYRNEYGNYPSDQVNIYAQFIRKRSDSDPMDKRFMPFKYRVVDQQETVDTAYGRLLIERGQALLYSRGQDHEDGRAREHTDDGFTGDIVVWPPIKALSREQGLM